ncbi:glycoside hydrolase family 30 [Actinobacteria bacterium OK074]|nr:glycoside hydrolase family 30 [Actinobacteria bacterium OK074]
MDADPGGPTATPKYVWDHYDKGQVWLAQQAKAYGVNRFYADAWTAPGYMKTNGTDANGVTLCGLSGATCASGDWRTAYANYLVRYAKSYAQEGIAVTDLGFTNEPDRTATYDSMRLTPAQAVEFTKVFGPIANAAGYRVSCCDSFGWSRQKAYSGAIEADPAARNLVTTHTGHTYAGPVDGPLPTAHRTWMSEWSPDGTTRGLIQMDATATTSPNASGRWPVTAASSGRAPPASAPRRATPTSNCRRSATPTAP